MCDVKLIANIKSNESKIHNDKKCTHHLKYGDILIKIYIYLVLNTYVSIKIFSSHCRLYH